MLGGRADENELREFARANIGHFKPPHSVTFIKELPKTATGMIQKPSALATDDLAFAEYHRPREGQLLAASLLLHEHDAGIIAVGLDRWRGRCIVTEVTAFQNTQTWAYHLYRRALGGGVSSDFFGGLLGLDYVAGQRFAHEFLCFFRGHGIRNRTPDGQKRNACLPAEAKAGELVKNLVLDRLFT